MIFQHTLFLTGTMIFMPTVPFVPEANTSLLKAVLFHYISTCGKMMVSWCTRTLTVPVDVDGLRVGAPYSEALLDDLLDFWEVGLQGLVAEHFGKHLERRRERHVVSFIIPNVTTLV